MVGGTNKPLFIRADANTRMGTGHVMRCIALGQAWMDAEEKAEDGGKKAEGGSLKPEDGEMSDGGGEKAEGGNLKPEDGEMSDGGGKKAEGGNLRPEDGEMSDGGGEKAEGGNLKADNSSLRSHPSSFPSVVFICAEIPDALAERVKSEGFDLIRINAEKGSPEDLRQTLDIISSLRFQVSSFIPPTGLRFQVSSLIPPTGLKSHPSSLTQWLVTDGYHFNLDYQRGIRAAGIKLLLIDDYNHLPEYEADILVNQNIGAEEIDYRCNPECRKLLGTNYVMLRREFRNAKPRERKGSPKNILVTMGGADPDNVTLKVIEALQELNIPNLHVKIIVGPANPHLETLQQAVSLSTINCELVNAARDMPGLMQWADLAVSAAGSTCWELCCLGVPFMTIILAENQELLARELERQGVARCFDATRSADAIAAMIEELAMDPEKRARCSGLGKDMVDEFGADRILYQPVKEAGLCLFDGRLALRPASESDMELFGQWANDPSVRANCYNPEAIPANAHRKWFLEKLSSGDTLMLVLELNGIPVGQIRYDRRGETADIGFSIDKRFRGLGLGRKIIEQSLERAFSTLRVKAVRAEVFSANSASRIAFVKTGFELMETREIKGVPSHIFVRKRP